MVFSCKLAVFASVTKNSRTASRERELKNNNDVRNLMGLVQSLLVLFVALPKDSHGFISFTQLKVTISLYR